MADTDSTSRFGSASIDLKKEILSKATPQNTKSCTKFAFNIFDGIKVAQQFCTPAILLNLKFVSFYTS